MTDMSEFNQSIQQEKDELNEMKKIQSILGISISKLIDLKNKGYKIIKLEKMKIE